MQQFLIAPPRYHSSYLSRQRANNRSNLITHSGTREMTTRVVQWTQRELSPDQDCTHPTAKGVPRRCWMYLDRASQVALW